MRDSARQTIRQIFVAITIVFIFLFLASSIISSYEKVDIVKGFEMTFLHIISLGGGENTIGNVFYVVIIFFSLGVIYYIFENFVNLLSELRIGGIWMRLKLSSIKAHYIICGAGRVGTHVAEKLKKEGKKVVVIENDPEVVKDIRRKGYTVIDGDCTEEEILEKAKIRKAKGLIACTGTDENNVFLVLTAKDLNPNIKVATRVNNLKVIGEFKRAGANVIVAPEVSGGFELAEKIMKK